jgi:hypothetical protein
MHTVYNRGTKQLHFSIPGGSSLASSLKVRFTSRMLDGRMTRLAQTDTPILQSKIQTKGKEESGSVSGVPKKGCERAQYDHRTYFHTMPPFESYAERLGFLLPYFFFSDFSHRWDYEKAPQERVSCEGCLLQGYISPLVISTMIVYR